MKTAVCLMGPTASGKTALAVELASRGPFEIVSVDSALIYRGMDIGTAKPDRQTLAVAPHRLIDLCDPAEAYSVARFREDCLNAMEAIHATGRIPLLTGGTMMYFRALEFGLSELPAADERLRARLLREAERSGWGALHDRLRQVDARAAERIMARKKRWRRMRPARSISISTARQGRSSCGLREQRSFDSASGSIGTTRSGK